MKEVTPQFQMAQLITGFWMSHAVYAAAKLEIADMLASGGKTPAELASASNTHARSLYRLLRALANIGIFAEQADGKFVLTPLASMLRKDVPGSQWAFAVMMGEETTQCWAGLLESVRTGTTAFDRIYGKPIFEYLSERPEQARIFDAAMTAIHGRETRCMLDAYDLSDVKTIADIGGGNGSNLIGILTRYPKLRGVLFDLPHVVERAKEPLAAAGLTGRCEVVAGDFFAEIPVQADAYILRHIIHDWDDERSRKILSNIERSMPGGAKVLVIEHVLPPLNEPSFGKFLDLTMLLMPGGLERTEHEFCELYESAGFRLNQIVATEGDLSVVEGKRLDVN